MWKLAAVILGILVATASQSLADSTSSRLSYITVKGSKTISSDDDSALCCVYISWQYPEFISGAGAPVLDSLNRLARTFWPRKYNGDTSRLTIEGFIEDPLADFLTFRRENADYRGPGWDWKLNVTVCVNDDGILGLDCQNYGWWGGAHGHSSHYYPMFDLSSGEALSFDDLVGPKNRSALTRIGEVEFRRVRKLPDDASISERFDFPNGEFGLNDNFSIDSTGLFFFYNEFEIAGYAAGATKVSIPWDSLAIIVDSAARLRPFIEEYRK